MARYTKDYNGERRTEKVTVQLTPSERAALQQRAQMAGAPVSRYARELCLRRSGATPVVAGARRSPEARALIHELTAIGNNLNQLARLSNTHRTAPQHHELKSAIDLLKAAMSRVLAL